jgi:hypothetical protein
MDAAPAAATGATTSERDAPAALWSGDACAHDLALVLSLVLPQLPLDARASAACVRRAWRTATASLRSLRLDTCTGCRVHGLGVLAALRGGGCTGVRHLHLTEPTASPFFGVGSCHHALSARQALKVAAACPLNTAALGVHGEVLRSG